jgi:hypothetical protein
MDQAINPIGIPLDTIIYSLLVGGGEGDVYGSVLGILSTLWSVYSLIALIASGFFIFGIIYAYTRGSQLSQIEEEQIEKAHLLWKELYAGHSKNARWLEIENHLDSTNPNDWKLAIIEADIMLGQILTNAGYAGSSIGEQLKSISPNTINSLQDVWNAHKVRNQIAHEGSDFILTQKVARDTILQYQRFFQECNAL